MFYVGLVYSGLRLPHGLGRVIKVRQEPFPCIGGPAFLIAFNERRARVAVRRYVKGNLAAALVCFDDGMNEPADARDAKYATNLSRNFMVPGPGPGGFLIDDGRAAI